MARLPDKHYMRSDKCSICNDTIYELLTACHNCQQALLPLCIFCIEDTSCPFCDIQLALKPTSSPNNSLIDLEEENSDYMVRTEIFSRDSTSHSLTPYELDFADENDDPDIFGLSHSNPDRMLDSEEILLNEKRLDMNCVFENARNEIFAQMDENGYSDETCKQEDGEDKKNNVADAVICMDDDQLNEAVNECIIEIENELNNVAKTNVSSNEENIIHHMFDPQQVASNNLIFQSDSRTELDPKDILIKGSKAYVDQKNNDAAENKNNIDTLRKDNNGFNIKKTNVFESYNPKEPERDPCFIKKIGSINQLTGELSVLAKDSEEQQAIHIEKGFTQKRNIQCEDKKVSGLVAFFEEQMRKQ